MNERQIPAPARGHWPILATNQHPLWLIGYTLDHHAPVQGSSQVVVRIWVDMTFAPSGSR